MPELLYRLSLIYANPTGNLQIGPTLYTECPLPFCTPVKSEMSIALNGIDWPTLTNCRSLARSHVVPDLQAIGVPILPTFIGQLEVTVVGENEHRAKVFENGFGVLVVSHPEVPNSYKVCLTFGDSVYHSTDFGPPRELTRIFQVNMAMAEIEALDREGLKPQSETPQWWDR